MLKQIIQFHNTEINFKFTAMWFRKVNNKEIKNKVYSIIQAAQFKFKYK